MARQRADVLCGPFRRCTSRSARCPRALAEQTEKLNVPFASVNCLVLVRLLGVVPSLGVFKAEAGKPSRSGKLWQIKEWGMREWYVTTYHSRMPHSWNFHSFPVREGLPASALNTPSWHHTEEVRSTKR